jgi:hypothetical protein
MLSSIVTVAPKKDLLSHYTKRKNKSIKRQVGLKILEPACLKMRIENCLISSISLTMMNSRWNVLQVIK